MGIRKIVMLAAVALLWCCDGEDTLLDQYPMEPIVSPEVGVLIDDNYIIHAGFGARQQITGITTAGLFSTDNKFQSLGFEPHPWTAAEGTVAFGNDLIAHVQTDGAGRTLRYSSDKGKTWETYDKPFLSGDMAADGTMAVVALSVASERSIWLLCRQGSGVSIRTLLYRVELERQRSTLVLDRAGADPLAFGFSDAAHGWILYGGGDSGRRSGRVHVLRTGDGGTTWADGAVLDGVDLPAVEPVGADELLVYGRGGRAYHSADGGQSFVAVDIGGEVSASQAASAGVVYALLENGVSKSADGGRTWTTLDTFVHGVEVSGMALDFRDERSGIVYGPDRLFLTDNGGESWEVLVYPYDYVFDGGGSD